MSRSDVVTPHVTAIISDTKGLSTHSAANVSGSVAYNSAEPSTDVHKNLIEQPSKLTCPDSLKEHLSDNNTSLYFI